MNNDLRKAVRSNNITGSAAIYTARLENFNSQADRARIRITRLAFLRLFIFLATLILTYFATVWGAAAVALVLVSGISFFLLTVKRFIWLQRHRKHCEILAAINENELKALSGDYTTFYDGAVFEPEEHAFASDLDIFGKGSLYQYFNRCATSLGRERLAGWFSEPLQLAGRVSSQQSAVNGLKDKLEWRHEFLATGYEVEEKETDREEVVGWMSEVPQFTHWKFRLMTLLVPLATFSIVILASLDIIDAKWILTYLVVPFGIIGLYSKKINRKHQMLSHKAPIIKKYGDLLHLIESEDFQAPYLQELKDKLESGDSSPSEATRRLSKILDAFGNRLNMLMGFLLNFFLLWDILQVLRLERWQVKYRDRLPSWLEVIAEADALCSLANFHFNHPGSVFPEMGGGPLIEAKGLGHPLIHPQDRVDNPVDTTAWKNFTIVTGANMAGKSTYLRTVGVNLVLAMMGSAVLAGEMKFRPVQLMTSIRTRDSLQKNESYFYAELKRLKRIIDTLEAGTPLFILLDEILKGTNSKDKQSGSFALVRKLLRYEASGFIATHDLALGELEKEYPGQIVNKCFEVVIVNNRLAFDYKLKDGIAQQMNATFLMGEMGIT